MNRASIFDLPKTVLILETLNKRGIMCDLFYTTNFNFSNDEQYKLTHKLYNNYSNSNFLKQYNTLNSKYKFMTTLQTRNSGYNYKPFQYYNLYTVGKINNDIEYHYEEKVFIDETLSEYFKRINRNIN